MLPNSDQIRTAAYFRWIRRGGGHGRDLDDWATAEQDLLFALNYRVLAGYRIDSPSPIEIGGHSRRVCRTCELAEPRTTFSAAVSPIPAYLGNTALVSLDRCDNCRMAAEALNPAVEAFTRPFRQPADGHHHGPEVREDVPVEALKGLSLMAVSILPDEELEPVQDTIEWALNPDHAQDRRALAGARSGVVIHRSAEPRPVSWAAVARRVDQDTPVPYLLFFLATPNAIFELPLPLCGRDQDFDGETLLVPRTAPTL